MDSPTKNALISTAQALLALQQEVIALTTRTNRPTTSPLSEEANRAITQQNIEKLSEDFQKAVNDLIKVLLDERSE